MIVILLPALWCCSEKLIMFEGNIYVSNLFGKHTLYNRGMRIMKELLNINLDYLVEILSEKVPKEIKYKKFPSIRAEDVNNKVVLKSYLERGIPLTEAVNLADNYFWTRKRMPIFVFKLSGVLFNSFDDIDEEKWNEVVSRAYRELEIGRVEEIPKLWQVYINRTFNAIQLAYIVKLQKKDYYINPRTFRLEKVPKIGMGCVTIRAGDPIVDVRGRNINSKIAKEIVHRALDFLGGSVEGVVQLKFNNPEFIRTLLRQENIDALGYLSLRFNSSNEPGVITYSARKKSGGKVEVDLRSLREVQEKVEKVLSGGGSINSVHGDLQVNGPFENMISFGVNFKENLVLLFNVSSESSIRQVINKVHTICGGVGDDSRTIRRSLQASLERFFSSSEHSRASS